MRRLFFVFALLILAACNLEAASGPVATPTFAPLPTTSYVAPTPYRGPTLVVPTLIGGQSGQSGQSALGGQSVVATSVPGSFVAPTVAPTPLPTTIPAQASQNVIEAFVNNLIIPLWNFVYTFFLEGFSTLWQFAGARGGVFAQLTCCVAPVIIAGGAVALRLRLFRWRR